MSGANGSADVNLNRTDFMILDALREGRNSPANLGAKLDRARNYISNRLSYLVDYGLVEKIGPLEDSGIYELTLRGEIVADHKSEFYDDDFSAEEFEALIDEVAKSDRDG